MPDPKLSLFTFTRLKMLKKSLVAILSVASLSESHLGDSDIRNELKKIRTIDDDDKRLLAYDTIAGSIDQDSLPQNLDDTGKWLLGFHEDRMTDKVTPYIHLKSSSPVKDWLSQDMTMVLRMWSSKYGALALSIQHLGDGTAFETPSPDFGQPPVKTTPFTLRVDKTTAVTLRFNVDNGLAKYAPEGVYGLRYYDGPTLRNLIKEICKGDELLVRFKGFDGETKYVSFDSRGLGNALTHLEAHSKFEADFYRNN